MQRLMPWVTRCGVCSPAVKSLTLLRQRPCWWASTLKHCWADKGYDADRLLEYLAQQGTRAVFPPKSNRLQQRDYDQHLYKDLNLVERFFNRIKQFRRIATRYEKLARNFFAMFNLVCAYLWLA